MIVARPVPAVTELLERRAAAAPHAVAAAVAERHVLTFGDWERRANALARGLVERGVAPGDHLLVVYDLAGWTELAVAWMGARKAGAATVVLAPPLGRFELDRIVADWGAVGVVCDAGLKPALERGWVACPAQLEAGQAVSPLAGPPPGAPPDRAYVSGPLRRPQLVSAAQCELPGGPVSLVHAFPPGTTAAGAALALPLHHPGAIAVALPRFDPEQLCRLLVDQRFPRLGLPRAVAEGLLASGALQDADLSSVTHVVLASTPGLDLFTRLGRCFPAASLVTLEGPRDPEGSLDAEGEPAPLASSQEGMVWHEQLVPGCQNLPALARRYRGPLDVGALERALGEILRRHHALRTTFHLVAGQLRQVVSPWRPLALPVIDLAPSTGADVEAEVTAVVADASRRPFDLVRGPLFEPVLLRLSHDDHVLVIRVHHSVYDDWSVGPFRRELSSLYTSLVTGTDPALPDLPVQLADVARIQHRVSSGASGADELAWWRRHLAGAPLGLQLPLGDPDLPPGHPSRPPDGPVVHQLPPGLVTQARTLAAQHRATLFMTMLGAFCLLLRRDIGQDDVLLSTVVANRDRTEVEGLIGCLTKKVLLRVRLEEDACLAEALARVRTALLESLAHQVLPFETVLQGVLGPQAAAHGLVPAVTVVFQGETPEPRRAKVALPGLTTVGFETSTTTGRSHFAAGPPGRSPVEAPWGGGLYLGTFLILSLNETDEGLRWVARGAFHPPAVVRLLDRYQALLADAVAHPHRPASQLRVEVAGEGRSRVDGGTLGFRGFAVEPARIEAALATCAGVTEAAVVVQPGPGREPRLVAYVVPAGRPPTLEELRRAVWERLPGYAWPAAAVMVPLLPRGSDGGLDHHALPPPVEGPTSPPSPEARVLEASWVDARASDGQGNYWQQPSFLEAVAAAAAAGLPVRLQQVARCRTVQALATAVATEPDPERDRP